MLNEDVRWRWGKYGMEWLTEKWRMSGCSRWCDHFVFYHVQLDVWMYDGRTGDGDHTAQQLLDVGSIIHCQVVVASPLRAS